MKQGWIIIDGSILARSASTLSYCCSIISRVVALVNCWLMFELNYQGMLDSWMVFGECETVAQGWIIIHGLVCFQSASAFTCCMVILTTVDRFVK